MISLFFITFIFANSTCDKVISVNPEYLTLQQSINSKLEEAVHLETIAKEADGVLAKLIANKSPVLMDWLKDRDLSSAKEEEIAKAWRLYYFHKFVLDQFPTDNAAINRSLDNLWGDFQKIAFDEIQQKKINGLLEKVKKDSKNLILSWPVEKKAKQSILHRIDTIQLSWFSHLENSLYEKQPLQFLSSSLIYDSSKHQIHVGLKTKSAPTDANLYALLAQALAHSFDSCQWGLYISGEYPFKNIESCLRNSNGVKALTRDDSQLSNFVQNKKLSKEMGQGLQQNPTCNNELYPPSGLQKDQATEAFADWFATEVFATSSFNKQLPRPDLCQEIKWNPQSALLPPMVRLEKIYLIHPQLKSLSKRLESPFYCSFLGPTAH